MVTIEYVPSYASRRVILFWAPRAEGRGYERELFMIFAHLFEDFSVTLNSFCTKFGVNQAWGSAEVSAKFRENP